MGFVYGHHSTSSVRRLLNIIQLTSQCKQKALAVSLDAEKAFDRVEWGYLFDVIWRFGRRSEPFPIARGVRQGCPLSRLLFALALEPLAQTIRLHTDIKAITIGHKEHKIALYIYILKVFVLSSVINFHSYGYLQ